MLLTCLTGMPTWLALAWVLLCKGGEISPERQPLSPAETLGPDCSRVSWKEAQVLISLISPHRNRWLQDSVEQEDRRSAGLEESGSDLARHTVHVENSFEQ